MLPTGRTAPPYAPGTTPRRVSLPAWPGQAGGELAGEAVGAAVAPAASPAGVLLTRWRSLAQRPPRVSLIPARPQAADVTTS